MTKFEKPYGTWDSKLVADDVAGATIRFGLVRGGEDGAIYWSEGRPAEKGRCVIMRKRPGDETEELLPPPFSARSRVHEYGGGEFTVAANVLYFINNEDQDIYRLTPGQAPERITEEPEMRFADIILDDKRNRLIAVGERQSGDHDHPENLIVSIDLSTAPKAHVTTLLSGQDFYAAPTINAEGSKLAWLAWNLPDMPWDSATLYVAEIQENGVIENARRIAGDATSAVFQPTFSSNGNLTFVWDKTGWANLYSWDGSQIDPLTTEEHDYSRPQWTFGMRAYCDYANETHAAYFKDGHVRLSGVKGQAWPQANALRSIETLVSTDTGLAALATTDVMAPAVVAITQNEVSTIRTSGDTDLSQEDISAGEPISFLNRDGERVYGLYYPPQNSKYVGPANAKPPILFTVHGGPTGIGDRGLKLKIQYWTNRGFGVFDTDYSGSTGYGRVYMERLDGQWGIKDVSDIADAATHMVAQGHADPARLFITGSSAGGMTVLLALADHDVFAGGVCTYGVTDLAHLLKFTHKFEAGYLYRLLGIEPGDDASPVLSERSPITKAEMIDRPLIFFQGLDDKIVPPEQSRRMVNALRQNGVAVEYVEFEGEAHGFRQASTIKTVLESEHAFYKRVLNLDS